MKKKLYFLFPLIFLLLFYTGCPQLDPENAGQFALRVMQNIPGVADMEVRVIDIDPPGGINNKAIVYPEDALTGFLIPNAKAHVANSSTVFVAKEGDSFSITGLAGGMGIVTITDSAGTKSVDLHVFVRNWKSEDVYRHTLEPDPEHYWFDKSRAPDEGYGPGKTFHDGNVFVNVPNSWTIYKLIVDRGYFYEAPDGVAGQGGQKVHNDRSNENWNRSVHNVPHVLYHPEDIVAPYGAGKEEFLRKTVFAFVMHYEYDGDMVGGYPDRQRLELKTMNNSTPPNQQGAKDLMYSMGGGDTFTYRWKFKLPEDFKVSTEYTHIHQIKPEGADNGNPIFTLTARKKSNNQEVMQLIYRGPIREMVGDREIPSVNWYPSEVPLDSFRGEWIRAEETCTYDNPGAYRISVVRIRDMNVLMEYEYNPEVYDEEDPFVMFRKGNTYVRAKTGVYRRIMHMTPFGLPNPQDPVLEFNDEGDEVRVLYTDFEMDKWKD